MGLLTTRQKQELIKPLLLFLLIGGFVGALWQGNPVALTVLVILVLAVGAAIFFNVRKNRSLAAAKAEQRRLDSIALENAQRRVDEAAKRTAVTRERLRQVRFKAADQVTVNFQIPIMSNDTLESLTVRVMEDYAERGGTISVTEAKAMAAKALAEQSQSEQATD
ncbi:hypothetical protein [Arthrobacter sp. efr-133-R2A-63]|uniref:hypothetical protein n=1 Tax=Arthrobacter sp. efr-133-R2A-63 TaxID=3040278 RepID=UPI00254BF80A|nr:hypothetical protein [Arthrobacter sp. efr-133-R2A-63]